MASICRPSIGLNMELASTSKQILEQEPRSPLQGPPKLEKCSFCPGDDEIPVGASKFGGFADLPIEWISDEIPRLILQLNLSEIPDDCLGRAMLPKDGILYVLSEPSFHGAGGQAYVRYWPGPTSHLRRVAPSDADTEPYAGWWQERLGRLQVYVVQRDPTEAKEKIIFLDESTNKGYVRIRYASLLSHSSADVDLFPGNRYLIGGCFVWRAARISYQEIFSVPNPGYDDHVVDYGTNGTEPKFFNDLFSAIRDFHRPVAKHYLLGYSRPLQRSYESNFQRACDTRRLRQAFKLVHGQDLEQMLDEENGVHQNCKREALVREIVLVSSIFSVPSHFGVIFAALQHAIVDGAGY